MAFKKDRKKRETQNRKKMEISSHLLLQSTQFQLRAKIEIIFVRQLIHWLVYQ